MLASITRASCRRSYKVSTGVFNVSVCPLATSCLIPSFLKFCAALRISAMLGFHGRAFPFALRETKVCVLMSASYPRA